MKHSEHICPPWLSWTLINPVRRLTQDPERTMRPFVKRGDTVADIGCGPGYFTAALARLVGESGRVLAVDVQPEMLERTGKRAARAGLRDRVILHLALQDGLGLPADGANLAVAFWMAHEVPDKARLFGDVLEGLVPGGTLLLAELRLHVRAKGFEEIVEVAVKTGFASPGRVPILMSRAVLLRKPGVR
jgi:ubiquinone/menaquinone biosynthesis C-methylase UbiE